MKHSRARLLKNLLGVKVKRMRWICLLVVTLMASNQTTTV